MTVQTDFGPLLTINQAATLCAVTRRTVYNWLEAGKVDYVRTPGGAVRIFEETLWQCVTTSRIRSVPQTR